LVNNSKRYEGADSDIFLKALDQTGQLADKIIAGSFNAYFNSHLEEVGKANWEKEVPSE